MVPASGGMVPASGGGATHWPVERLQVFRVPVQALQVLPPAPHRLFDSPDSAMQLPARQHPVHPAQPDPASTPASLAPPTQAPLVQVCPALHTEQFAPFFPHAAAVVPPAQRPDWKHPEQLTMQVPADEHAWLPLHVWQVAPWMPHAVFEKPGV
jgi:hypothetical protein